MHPKTHLYNGLAALGLAVLLAACTPAGDSGADAGSTSPPSGTSPAGDEKTLAAGLDRAAAEVGTAQDSLIAAMRVVSAGFSLDLSEELPPEPAIEPYFDALGGVAGDYARLLATAHELAALEGAQALSVSAGALKLGRLGQERSPLLFEAAVIIGGVALIGVSLVKGIAKAVDTAAGPARSKIESATPEELRNVQQTLGLPADTSRENTLQHFDDLGVGDKLSRSKDIQSSLLDAAVRNEPGVNPIEGSEIARATANSAVILGETGVKANVSALTTITGGQGMAQVAGAAGMSAEAAAVADLTVTAVEEATGTPLQPLSVFAESMSVTATSDETRAATAPVVESGPTPDDARATLRSEDASTDALTEAADVLAGDTLARSPEAHGASKAGGTWSYEAPKQAALGRLEQVKGETRVELPKMGPANVLLQAAGQEGRVYPDVDLSGPAEVRYPVKDEAAPPATGGARCANTPLAESCMPGFLAPVMETCMGVTPDTSCTFHIIMGEHDIPTGDSVTCYGNGASLFVDLTETGTNESEFRGPGGETCATKVIAPDPGGESLTEQWTDAAGNTLVVRSGKETISVDCPGNVTELYDPKELVGVDCLPSLPAGSRCPKGSCD